MSSTIRFHGGFHLASMLVALAAGVAGGMEMQEHRGNDRALAVTEYHVVGQGCGVGSERDRTYIAIEEDDLPGPECDIVFELVEPDYN
jgi:hypothetical protein